MPTNTTNLDLVLYDEGAPDSATLFLTWRSAIDGLTTSNFVKIDDGYGVQAAQIADLEARSTVTKVNGIYDSGSLYLATVAGIASYIDKALILLSLDITNPGTTQININSLGARTLVKVNTSGTSINLTANDLRPNRLNLFMYDLASTTFIWVGSTAADTLNIIGTAGNLVSVNTDNTLLGTLTQSQMLSQTTHAATGKSTPADADSIPLVDTAASNVLKKITWAQIRTNITTALGAIIAAATEKTIPIGADLLGIADTADSNNTKKVTITNLFAQLGILTNAFTAKTTPAVADVLPIGDSAASFAAKKITITNLFTILGTYIDSITAKTTPVTGDEVLLADSAASFANKKVTIGNIFGVLGTFINGYTDKASPVAADLLAIADSAASFAVKKLSLTNLLVYLRSFLSINAPEGFLQNGQINVTVASNNITVAIKTLSGGNPSATDPVYVRINGVIRSITAALSVTKNAGTNWFASGATMLATNEIDYFTYLGYNATDGVVVGFARFSSAAQYSDFSTTGTNEKYCAISTITNAASTDYYVVIGRFAATLSATASFNWSVPTFTAINLINRPIYETRWITYAPVITSATGTITTVSAAGRYQISYRKVYMDVIITITTNGTGATALDCPLPISCHALNEGTYAGRENAVTGSLLVCWLSSATSIRIQKYDSTYIGADGRAPAFLAVYEMA